KELFISKMKELKFPIKYIEDNLIFNHNGTVWAYFKINGFSYDFLSFENKKEPFFNQLVYLNNLGTDIHLLLVPSATDVSEVIDNTIEDIKGKDYALKKNGIALMEETKKQLERHASQIETSEY